MERKGSKRNPKKSGIKTGLKGEPEIKRLKELIEDGRLDVDRLKSYVQGQEARVSPDDILTLEEAASYLKISRATMYRLLKAGALPARRIGGAYRFSRRVLLAWVEKDD